jgi:hypothetical protein
MVRPLLGGNMFPRVMLLGAALLLASCSAPKEWVAAAEAQKKAQLEAAKIPEVQLTAAQLAALTVTRERLRVAWVRAGIQKEDGKIFACAVLAGGKDTFWTKQSVAVITGTFEQDGSFSNKYNILIGEQDPIGNCQRKGFDPPVRVERSVTMIRI